MNGGCACKGSGRADKSRDKGKLNHVDYLLLVGSDKESCGG
jgi:hypothetical protein